MLLAMTWGDVIAELSGAQQSRRLLRRHAPRNDVEGCHCELNEVKRGNLGDCFVAMLLAMTWRDVIAELSGAQQSRRLLRRHAPRNDVGGCHCELNEVKRGNLGDCFVGCASSQ